MNPSDIPETIITLAGDMDQTDLQDTKEKAVRIMMHILFFHMLKSKGFNFRFGIYKNPHGYELSTDILTAYEQLNALGADIDPPELHIQNHVLQKAINLITAHTNYHPRHLGDIYESTISFTLHSKEDDIVKA